jgi:hypothetical protein
MSMPGAPAMREMKPACRPAGQSRSLRQQCDAMRCKCSNAGLPLTRSHIGLRTRIPHACPATRLQVEHAQIRKLPIHKVEITLARV